MDITDRLRLPRNPRPIATPQGSDDLFFDVEGRLIRQDANGNQEEVGGVNLNSSSIAAAMNSGTEDTAPADSDRLAVVSPAGGWLLLSRVWDYIKAKLDGVLTIAGAKTLSGQLELTGQAATNATSAMTRGLADSRFMQIVRAFATTDAAAIQSQTTLQDTGLSVTLEPGTWHVHARTVTTNANAAAQAKFGGVITGGTFSELYGGIYIGTGNAVANGDTGAAIFTTTRAYTASSSRTYIDYDFTVVVTGGNPVLKTQYAQNVSTAADTIRKAGSYIVARKV